MPDDSGTTARRSASGNAALLGAMLVVVAACCRASAGFTMLPGWESSPMDFVAPESNWTPMLSLGLDAVSLLGAMLCMTGTNGGGPRSRLWLLAPIALLLGLASVAGRLLLRDAGGASGSIDDLVLGSSWVASVGGMLGLMHACREAKCRGVALGTLSAFLVVLVGKGLLQTLVEQPATMQMFKQSREAFFASRGWSPDSPLARGFERRVMQTEASGWFGLANVFATFMAGGVTLGLATLVLAWRERAKARWAGLVLLIACGIGLVQCGSKGGFAVALLGGVFVVIAEWAGRGMRVLPRWLGPSLGVFAITSVIGGVIARGLIGERIGELSLLFRWFYMQGATRAFLEHPMRGTGPAGFQEAYMRLKPPISPEDVASPHSVLFDWCATLGIGGIAWCVLLIAAAMVIGRGVIGAGRGASCASLAPLPNPSPPGRGFEGIADSVSASLMKSVFLAAAFATLFGAWCERLIVSPESAAVRFGGLIAWTWLGGVLAPWFARGGRTPAAAACAGGLALLAHMQMDVTSVNPMSAALVFAFIGAAAGAGLTDEAVTQAEPARSKRGAFALVAGCVILLALLQPIAGLVRVVPWENALRESAELAQRAGSLRMKLSEVRQSPTQEGIDALKRGLERALGRAVVARPEAIEAGLLELDNAAGTAAAARLKDAADREPAHVGTVSSLGQLQSRLAETLTRAGQTEQAKAMIGDARKRASIATTLRPRSINAWQWRASAEAATSQVLRDDRNLVDLLDAYKHCIELAPYSLAARVGLVETTERIAKGRSAESLGAEDAKWVADLAREALRVDDLLHLDPLIRLTTEQRRRIEALANVKTP
ncbi:MAG: O-antigen ligase family protein [Planctomycetota bacterium]|nr:O-antigen ligase family protein [Planctomycetota bacterium]